jgi:hypothetical protein
VTAAELLERWTNVERVLEAMPEHERQHHWDMSTWGTKTTCGTVACAAGTCGLDPWFRERGFKLDFNRQREARISDVPGFFGLEGSKRIFYNSQQRPVETVLGEVREFVAELTKIEALTAGLAVPAIGAEWPEQGGIYAGAMLGKNGAADYLLIVGPEHEDRLTWRSANEWAANLTVGDFHDFALFDRVDGAALFDRVRGIFQRTWYWTSEQHADFSSFAWMQGFHYGDQSTYGKGSDDRARAVRRIPIRSFGNSVISADGAS